MKVAQKPAVNSIVEAHEPIRSAPIPRVGMDARMQVTLLVADVMATLKASGNPWRAFAGRVIALPTDGRDEFIKQVKAQLKDMKASNIIGNQDKKAAAKAVASSTVELSRLTSVAKAFNAGGTVEGLCAFTAQSLGVPAVAFEEVSWYKVWQYAATLVKGKGGRTAKPWLEKMGSFLDNNAPEDDATPDEQALYKTLLQQYNEAVAKMAAAVDAALF